MLAEDFALVLDYIPEKHAQARALAQVIGTEKFTLLEVIPKEKLTILETVYIGKEKRTKIDFIKRRISFNELSNNSLSELDKAIEKIILDRKDFFLKFFNESKAISVRMHQLELLPGIGRKHMQEILKARKEKPFESFEEIEKRVHLMPNPVSLLVKRIIEELKGEEKYYLFVRKPPIKDKSRKRHYKRFFRKSFRSY